MVATTSGVRQAACMDTDAPITDEVRKQLRAAREAAGLSCRKLGGLLGITETQVFRIENGTRGTGIARAQEWFVACGFSVETVSVGEPERAALLATVLGSLPHNDFDDVSRVVRAWTALPISVRHGILSLISPYVPK